MTLTLTLGPRILIIGLHWCREHSDCWQVEWYWGRGKTVLVK